MCTCITERNPETGEQEVIGKTDCHSTSCIVSDDWLPLTSVRCFLCVIVRPSERPRVCPYTRRRVADGRTDEPGGGPSAPRADRPSESGKSQSRQQTQPDETGHNAHVSRSRHNVRIPCYEQLSTH